MARNRVVHSFAAATGRFWASPHARSWWSALARPSGAPPRPWPARTSSIDGRRLRSIGAGTCDGFQLGMRNGMPSRKTIPDLISLKGIPFRFKTTPNLVSFIGESPSDSCPTPGTGHSLLTTSNRKGEPKIQCSSRAIE